MDPNVSGAVSGGTVWLKSISVHVDTALPRGVVIVAQSGLPRINKLRKLQTDEDWDILTRWAIDLAHARYKGDIEECYKLRIEDIDRINGSREAKVAALVEEMNWHAREITKGISET